MVSPISMKRVMTQTAWILATVGLFSCGRVNESGSDIKLTEDRHQMTMEMASLCREPAVSTGPHHRAEVDLFLNEVAMNFRLKNPDSFDYPLGSEFRKRKYPGIGTREPDLETTMVRVAGDGGVEDWEFEMRELPSGQLRSKNDTSCQDCHANFEARGYVSLVSERYILQRLGRAGSDDRNGTGVR